MKTQQHEFRESNSYKGGFAESMHRFVGRYCGVAAIAICTWLLMQSANAQTNVIYSQDFTSSPGWTISDPTKLYWDSASGTFHGTQINTEGTYAYINLPTFDPNGSWRLEWDHIINSDDWSAGMTIGLFDSQLRYPYMAGEDMGIGDLGNGASIVGYGDSTTTYSPAWSVGVWYHIVIAYDPYSQQLALTVKVRSTGSVLLSLTRTVASFPAGLTRLGVSRLHMKGTPPGASSSATVDYNMDNIQLFQDLPQIYSQNFLSDPLWTSSDPTKLYWDSASGTFHGTQINTEGTYAYINLPTFDPNGSWRLEWDHIINSDDWSAGMTIGLFDSQLRYPYMAGEDMGIGDLGNGASIIGYGDSTTTYSPAWSTGVWYHSALAYDPYSQQLALTVKVRSTGSVLLSLTRTAASFPAGLTRLGVSRLHMKGTPPGASSSATVDYNLDNLALYEGVVPPVAFIRSSQVEICWPSRTNWLYNVQYCSSLTTNTWVNLFTNIAGTVGQTCVQDSILVGQPQRFYRVQVVNR